MDIPDTFDALRRDEYVWVDERRAGMAKQAE